MQEIARAFLVGEAAMEQRITRAKRRISQADVPFETPGAVERAERLSTVAAMIYLLFNEGYSASGGELHIREPLCEEAIRLTRLLLRLFRGNPEILGLNALLLLQHARAPARLDAEQNIVLMDDQDRRLWRRELIAEAFALLDKAVRLQQPGPYQIQAAIAAVHARAPQSEDTQLARDRSAVRVVGNDSAVAGGDVESRGRRHEVRRPGGGVGDDRAARVGAIELLPFPWIARRAADAAEPQRRSARVV